jgi:hypothetical protein
VPRRRRATIAHAPTAKAARLHPHSASEPPTALHPHDDDVPALSERPPEPLPPLPDAPTPPELEPAVPLEPFPLLAAAPPLDVLALPDVPLPPLLLDPPPSGGAGASISASTALASGTPLSGGAVNVQDLPLQVAPSAAHLHVWVPVHDPGSVPAATHAWGFVAVLQTSVPHAAPGQS